MSRFVTKKLKTIDLGNDEFVKVPLKLSFKDSMAITETTDPTEMSKKMLVMCIKEWNLKDEEGNIPEVNEENILNLDIETITILTKEITELISGEKDSKKK